MSGAFEAISGAKALRTEGESAQNLAEFNAQVSEQEAKASVAKSKFEQRRQVQRGAEVESSLRAKLGAAGGVGSPVAKDLVAAQAAENELGMLLTGFEGRTQAGKFEQQAILDRLGGKFAKQRSKNAARAANVGLGSQIATLGVLKGFPSKGTP